MLYKYGKNSIPNALRSNRIAPPPSNERLSTTEQSVVAVVFKSNEFIAQFSKRQSTTILASHRAAGKSLPLDSSIDSKCHSIVQSVAEVRRDHPAADQNSGQKDLPAPVRHSGGWRAAFLSTVQAF